MSEWTAVASSRRTSGKPSGAPDAELQAKKFLRTFKVSQCDLKVSHDWFQCSSWHNDNDRRRDYYEKPYSVNETRNKVEQSYHPEVFRMQMCKYGASCKFGSVCSYAHRQQDLRSSRGASSSADTSAESSVPPRPPPPVDASRPGAQPHDVLRTRSYLYRALTRAHMLVCVVNETLPRGWLAHLTGRAGIQGGRGRFC